MEVVIKSCFGGFGLSHKGVMRYAELSGIKLYPHIDHFTKEVCGERATLDNPSILIHYTTEPCEDDEIYKKNIHWASRNIERTDPILIQLIKEMGDEANSRFSDLKVVELPDDVEWTIEEYDGNEWVAEKHRKWDEDGLREG